jgi:hypothetical protein
MDVGNNDLFSVSSHPDENPHHRAVPLKIVAH